MGEVAIRVENLGKRYRLGTREPYRTLRDALAGALSSPFRGRTPGNGRVGGENGWIWALKDVSFEVRRGEVVGVIGRNGAGKSTLLKILSRITEPTEGRAEIHGRVGSLLEVGTGFHPELTGRENIYLSGALLGMSRREIDRRFDEIVEFAGIAPFLDTPVKRYSSGMYVRLAFAVAAHLEPEILLVDEVLAVGDAAFQKKCLGKMGEVAKEGRTVLFVSHNMGAITALCDKVLVLKEGKATFLAETSLGVIDYLNSSIKSESILKSPQDVILALEVKNSQGDVTNVWRCGEDLVMHFRLCFPRKIWEPALDITFYNEGGTKIFGIETDKLSGKYRNIFSTEAEFILSIRNPGFVCDYMIVDVGLKEGTLPYLCMWRAVATILLDRDGLMFKNGIISPTVYVQ